MAAQIDLRADLEDIVGQLDANGIDADINRDKVQTPGVWVTAASVSLDGLSYYTVHARMYVLVADRDPGLTFDDMTTVANLVFELFNPTDDLTPATVSRGGVQLPALVIPVDFRCDYRPTP